MPGDMPYVPNFQSNCFCGHGSAQHDSVNGCPQCPDHHLLGPEKAQIPNAQVLSVQP